METDASNQASAGVFSQYVVIGSVRTLHLANRHAKGLTTAERNWPIHDKELWAIVLCFRRWDSWLKSTINNYADLRGLQYFNTNIMPAGEATSEVVVSCGIYISRDLPCRHLPHSSCLLTAASGIWT